MTSYLCGGASCWVAQTPSLSGMCAVLANSALVYQNCSGYNLGYVCVTPAGLYADAGGGGGAGEGG